jgi:hypothetical protein
VAVVRAAEGGVVTVASFAMGYDSWYGGSVIRPPDRNRNGVSGWADWYRAAAQGYW